MRSDQPTQLGGWKAIAAYLGRDERTAMRWAAERGMPVSRVPGEGRGSVYALPAELDAWLHTGRNARTPAQKPPDLPTISASARTAHRWWAVVPFAILLAVLAWALLHRPTPETSILPAVPGFSDPAARALYLQATYDWNLRTGESLTRAVEEYSQAIGLDPRVAAAYVGLANSYLLLREYGSMPDEQAYPRAEAAAHAALALAPSNASMHRVLAFLAFWWHADPAAAGREFHQALRLAPNDPLTHHWFANVLSASGDSTAALREMNLALDLDPTSSAIMSDAGLVTYLSGDHRTGFAMLRRHEQEQPGDAGVHRSLADIALFEGRPADFLAELRIFRELRHDAKPLNSLTAAFRRGQQPLLLRVMLNETEAGPRSAGHGFYEVARVAALAGRTDEAERYLVLACRTGEPARVGAKGDLWLSASIPRERVAQLCDLGSFS